MPPSSHARLKLSAQQVLRLLPNVTYQLKGDSAGPACVAAGIALASPPHVTLKNRPVASACQNVMFITLPILTDSEVDDLAAHCETEGDTTAPDRSIQRRARHLASLLQSSDVISDLALQSFTGVALALRVTASLCLFNTPPPHPPYPPL